MATPSGFFERILLVVLSQISPPSARGQPPPHRGLRRARPRPSGGSTLGCYVEPFQGWGTRGVSIVPLSETEVSRLWDPDTSVYFGGIFPRHFALVPCA